VDQIIDREVALRLYEQWRLLLKSPFAAILLLSILTSAAWAEETSIQGIGVASCAQITKLYRADQHTEVWFFSWAQGFMSGINLSEIERTGRSRDLSDYSRQETYLRSFCDAYPLLPYARAVVSLFYTLPMNPPGKPGNAPFFP
jgi:hypothetical protein